MKRDDELDELFIQRCLTLAHGGIGLVEPNPYVGCVVVKEGKIIGEGFHFQFGGPHAEVLAIQSIKEKSNFDDAVLYVNLEPCSHYGKTPPCTDLIIQKGFRRVVIAMEDPNPLVNGNGIRRLREAGIDVKVGVCKDDALRLNRSFVTFHKQKRPYIILKWAQTRDGFIDILLTSRQRNSYWISSSLTDILTHSWRAREQAIMIGAHTLLKDDPQLTVRHFAGRNPLRIIMTSTLIKEEQIKKFKIYQAKSPILIFNPHISQKIQHVEWVKIPFNHEVLEHICDELYKRNIQSVIVEGGKQLLESFIRSNLWDEARVIVGNKRFYQGLVAPLLNNSKLVKTRFFDSDIIFYYKPL
ncbi:MAG: bifunctional diaminohydroxyphosphoribosylaminopyrimidine deaminase/5-amino-6-(5-phosphoribosylamino)uracil reductase RibD [Bacteroidales bacterium]|nr:bifunctional diaminohydroxyphosphoribosylaminopyrimidine deaminase/5-amino-6-(5-phosphoribosylamino)uracil reductase RibD [Bacteroidales bacterium]